MAKYIKSQNFSKYIAMVAFEAINPKHVTIKDYEPYGLNPYVLVSDVDPSELIYPYGWYFAKGALRNKHQSDTGAYGEIPIFKPGMKDRWESCVLVSDMEEEKCLW